MKKLITVIFLLISILSWGQVDTIPPNPVCKIGLTANFLKIGDSITLDASLFDAGSFDNTSPASQLTFLFEDTNQPTKTFYLNSNDEINEIKMAAVDEVGNSLSCHSLIRFNLASSHLANCDSDTIPPLGFQYTGASLVMGSSKRLILNVNNLIESLYDNISEEENLTASFGPDPNYTSRIFNCEDIEISPIIELTLYLWDEAGNYSTLNTYIIVQDPGDVCNDFIPDTVLPVSICHQELNFEIRPCLTTNEIFPGDLYSSAVFPDRYFTVVFANADYYQFGCLDIGVQPVEIVIDNSFGYTSTCTTNVEVSDPNNYCLLSTKDNDREMPFNIYPNPAQDLLFINSKVSLNKIILMDIFGKKIKELKVDQNVKNLDISGLPTGVYFVVVESELNVYSDKLIISK